MRGHGEMCFVPFFQPAQIIQLKEPPRCVEVIHCDTILYAQSRDKRTELVCVDRVVSCNYIYRELKERLPEVFYPLRRGYLVNTLFIVAVRRFEAELISGICIPIPALTYQQAKRDLQSIIGGK